MHRRKDKEEVSPKEVPQITPVYSGPLAMLPLCPDCNGLVAYRMACATYLDGEWVFCEGCNSAVQYLCVARGCYWYYFHGLHPENPQSPENELRRPQWISADQKITVDGEHTWIAPGVPEAAE